jgi:long-subunit acyl-CoA synthetase (AMP-forming)
MSKVIAALQTHASRNPHKPALIGDHLTLSWAELLEAVETLRESLQGVKTLGLFLRNGPQWVIADLAALASGTTCIPIPVYFSGGQVRHALRDAGVDHVICDAMASINDLAAVRSQSVLTIAGKQLGYLHLDGEPGLQNSGIAKITYTSGTTGNPKGVPLSLRQIEKVALSLKNIARGDALDRALVLLPLSTLLENIGSVYTPILAGATLLVPDAASLGFFGSSQVDALTLGQKLRDLQPTTAILVPQLLKLFIGLAATQRLPESFRFIAVGGAPVAASQLAQAQSLGLPVYQGYGMSEAASVVAMNGPLDDRPGSVGKLLPHCGLRIADDGEVLLSGTGFSGYLHEQNESTEAWYATGDLGFLDEDGYLFIDGRKREVIISAYGRNVSPEWVESELLAEASIAQAVVFGNDRPCLSAVIVGSGDVDAESIQQAVSRVNSRLPDYARVQEFELAEQPFRLAAGELTANGRPRRGRIEVHYHSFLTQ